MLLYYYSIVGVETFFYSYFSDEKSSKKHSVLPLKDRDITTVLSNGWRKVNTLRHYNIPDGVTMHIKEKEKDFSGMREVNGEY